MRVHMVFKSPGTQSTAIARSHFLLVELNSGEKMSPHTILQDYIGRIYALWSPCYWNRAKEHNRDWAPLLLFYWGK